MERNVDKSDFLNFFNKSIFGLQEWYQEKDDYFELLTMWWDFFLRRNDKLLSTAIQNLSIDVIDKATVSNNEEINKCIQAARYKFFIWYNH